MRSNRKKLTIILAAVLIVLTIIVAIPVVKYRLWAIVPSIISYSASEQKRDAEIQKQFTYLEEEIKELDDRIEKVVFEYSRPASLLIIVSYREASTAAKPIKELQEIVEKEKENIRQYYLEREKDHPNNSGEIDAISLCIDVNADGEYDHTFGYSYKSQKWNN